MSVAEVFGKARQVSPRIEHPQDERVCYDVPNDATHILVRPVRQNNAFKIFIMFFRVGLPGDYKPQNNSGKYFHRRNRAAKCRVEVRFCPNGWIYNVEWLGE